MTTELDFWKQVKENLKSKNLNNRPLQMWFEPTALIGVEDRSTGRCFLLGVPTELHKYWISSEFVRPDLLGNLGLTSKSIVHRVGRHRRWSDATAANERASDWRICR